MKKSGLWRCTWALALQDLRLRYHRHWISILWLFLGPVFFLLTLTLIFSRVAGMKSEGVPYLLFNLTGLIPWMYFAASLSIAAAVLMSNAHLILRVPFPRMSMPISSLVSSLPNFAAGLIVMSALFAFFGFGVGWSALYVLPIFAVQILLMAGVALLLSILMAYAREGFVMLMPILQLWMLASPIGYSLNAVPANLRPLFLLNPMAGLITSYRDVLLHHRAPDPAVFGSAAVLSLACLAAGVLVFKKLEPTLADYI